MKKNDIVVYTGDLNLGLLHELNYIVNPKHFLGNVNLSLLIYSKNLEKQTYVKGNLKRVNGNFFLN